MNVATLPGMGTTNLLAGLQYKYAMLAGELEDLEAEIAQTRAAYENLPETEARRDELRTTLDHFVAVILSVEPKWDATKVKARRAHARLIPTSPGKATQWAFEVLRDATEPMTAREIAKKVLLRAGDLEPTDQMILRMTNTVGDRLRLQRGNLVESDSSYPKLWWIKKNIESSNVKNLDIES